MFNSIYNVAAGALSANRLRINVVASNIANAETTRTEEGGPYKRRDVVVESVTAKREDFSSMLEKRELRGVRVSEIREDAAEPRMVYDPSHPDANPETGYVAMPNINPVAEMTNMLTASAAYKAMAEIVGVTKDMSSALKSLADKA